METQFKPIDPAQYAHAYQGIPYCDRDPLQVVDIYVPGDDGDYPLIVYVNGHGSRGMGCSFSGLCPSKRGISLGSSEPLACPGA